MSISVAVIDYGMGNLHSVASALAHVGADKVLIVWYFLAWAPFAIAWRRYAVLNAMNC